MLKWLVTRGPTTAPGREVVTDDPLATLRVKTKGNTHEIYAVSRVNPLYHDEEVEIAANVLVEEEEDEIEYDATKSKDDGATPESPPTDRGSVRSSGYGSKETDSVSEGSDAHEDQEILGMESRLRPAADGSRPDRKTKAFGKQTNVCGQANPTQSVAAIRKSFEDLITPITDLPRTMSLGGKPVATIVNQHPQFVQHIEVGMRRAKSLETFIRQETTQNSGSSTIPRPVWPRVKSIVEDLSKKSINSDYLRNKTVPKSIDIVKQNRRYVTAIDVLPQQSLSCAKSSKQVSGNFEISSNFCEGNTASPRLQSRDSSDFSKYLDKGDSDYQLMSLQPDSLVNEDTLRMMRYSHHEDAFLEEENGEPPIQVSKKESSLSMPDFSQVVYTKGLYATLNRSASLNTKDILKPPYRNKSKSFDASSLIHKPRAKKKGLSAVKDLWEKSGLKTNGRKLIVDVSDVLNSHEEDNNDIRESPFHNGRHEASFAGRRLSSHNYEDLPSYDSKYGSHTTSDSMESKSSGTYAEIGDIVNEGFDNPAFLGDNGQTGYSSVQELGMNNNRQNAPHKRFLDPNKLAEFQKKISEKLQSAPLHRMQWLDLDDIVIDDFDDRQGRRVKFTADTYNPNSLKRDMGGSQHAKRSMHHIPGTAVRELHAENFDSLGNRRLQPPTLSSLNRDSTEGERRGIWTTSESYRDRFQEAPVGTVGRARRQQLWESYYGSGGSTDHTLPRHLAPHPNSQAPFCGKPGNCHDFTLDLYRSDKLKRRSDARQKRRRCYAFFLITLALLVFIGAVVMISWYYTGGEKFFGPM